MGQCGCSDTTPDFQMPGPNGITYAIQIYPSCHYCSTPVGVDIYRFDPAEAVEWTDGVPELPFMSYGHENPVNAQASIPVLDPEALVKALTGNAEEEGENAPIDETDARFALPHAVWQTLSDWRALSTHPEES